MQDFYHSKIQVHTPGIAFVVYKNANMQKQIKASPILQLSFSPLTLLLLLFFCLFVCLVYIAGKGLTINTSCCDTICFAVFTTLLP